MGHRPCYRLVRGLNPLQSAALEKGTPVSSSKVFLFRLIIHVFISTFVHS